MWGFFVIVPVMADYVQPWVIDTLGDLPGIGVLFSGAPFGTGILTAALILAVMIIPFIAAIMRDVFLTVPPMFKESAYGIGCTTLGGDALHRAALHPRVRGGRHHAGPRPRPGRDDGGHLRDRQHQPHLALAVRARQHHRLAGGAGVPGGRTGSLKLSSLLALGFILFVISFIVLAISRLLLRPRAKG